MDRPTLQELHETRLELDARVERLSYAIETLRDEMASIDQARPVRAGNESDDDDSDEGRAAQSPTDADSSSAESLAAIGDGRLTLSPLSLESNTTTAPSSPVEPPFRASSPAPLEHTAGQYFVRPNFSPLRPSSSNPPPELDRLDTDGDRAARREEVSALRRSTPQRRTLPSLESTSYAPMPFEYPIRPSISNRLSSSSSGLVPSESSTAQHISESSAAAYIFPASNGPRRSLQPARAAIPGSANNDLPSPPAATTAHLISDTRLLMRERVEHLRAAFLSRGEHLRGAFPLPPPTLHTTAALDSNIASLPAPPRPSLPPSPSTPSLTVADSPEQDHRSPRPPVRSRTLRPPAMLPLLSRGPLSPSSAAVPNADMLSSFSSSSHLSAHRQPSYLSGGDDGGLLAAAAAAAAAALSSAHDNSSRRTQQQQQQDALRYRGPSLRHQQPQQQTAQAQAPPMAQARDAGGGGGSSFWGRVGGREGAEGDFVDSGEIEIWEAFRRSRENGMGPADIQDLLSTTSRAFFVSPLQRNSRPPPAPPALFDPNGLDYIPPATTPETPPAPTAASNSNGCAPDSLITPLPAWLWPWDNDEEGGGSAWHRFAAAVLFAEGSTEGSGPSEGGEGNHWVVVVSPRGQDDEEKSIPGGGGGEGGGGRFRRPGPVELPAFLWTQSASSQDGGMKRVRRRERGCTSAASSVSWVEVEGPREELEIGR